MKIKFKKTPILFISILIIPICICGGFYYLLIESNGGMALLGTIFIIALVINLIILFIEQAVLKKVVNLKSIWFTEIFLILVIILFSIYFSD